MKNSLKLISLCLFISSFALAAPSKKIVVWCEVPEQADTRLPGGNAYIANDNTADIWVRTFLHQGMKEVKINFANVTIFELNSNPSYNAINSNTEAFSLVQTQALRSFNPGTRSFEAELTVQSKELAKVGLATDKPVKVKLQCAATL